MYKVENLALDEWVLGMAEVYGIPRDRIVSARREECGGGFGGFVFVTDDGKERHPGCGHSMCTMCEWKSGIGIGDEARADFS